MVDSEWKTNMNYAHENIIRTEREREREREREKLDKIEKNPFVRCKPRKK